MVLYTVTIMFYLMLLAVIIISTYVCLPIWDDKKIHEVDNIIKTANRNIKKLEENNRDLDTLINNAKHLK